MVRFLHQSHPSHRIPLLHLPGSLPLPLLLRAPRLRLLHDSHVASGISSLLRRPDSGAVSDTLCAWLYDTFHTCEPDLHLVVLRFLPALAGVYLTRAALNKPLAGFESVLLAIYAHETASRGGQAVTVSIPDLAHSSIYHETKHTAKKRVHRAPPGSYLPSLEPFGTVRSTRRARIVGVALELYYSKISEIPVGSKIEFCEFCEIWSGRESEIEGERQKGRINLPWEVLQPVLRIVGHCLMGPGKSEELFKAAFPACKCLHARALKDINPKAILATGSLLKLAEMAGGDNSSDVVDYTEISMSNVITM
ncbi:hypothetical protein DH2020_010574 [Rehmannia glutinosa]|uniref:Hyccin n=1 Tax=Rehmannia glutinosa TaxID=99300 RepID=A0ABR0XB25_REHGL